MLQVQHLVVDDVLHGVARYRDLIKDAADDNRIVGRIVMPEDAPGLSWTPAHAWPAQQSMKKASVQLLKNQVEVIDAAFGRMQPLASAHLPHQVRLPDDFVTGHVFSITRRVAAIDGLAVHLRQQNVSDRPYNRVRRAFQQIRKPYQKPALAQPDGVIDVGESKKLDPQLRRHNAGTQLPVFIIEDFEQSGTHGEPRLARAIVKSDFDSEQTFLTTQ